MAYVVKIDYVLRAPDRTREQVEKGGQGPASTTGTVTTVVDEADNVHGTLAGLVPCPKGFRLEVSGVKKISDVTIVGHNPPKAAKAKKSKK